MDALYVPLRVRFADNKRRFNDGVVNLDLSYITERIIAMSYPADGMESTYRNCIDDVAAMLNARHPKHYLIYNLSGRLYDATKFQHNVETWCSFPDHHAPPFTLYLHTICHMGIWLLSDPLNVVVVHCQAGRGRTGTVISGFLLLSGLFQKAEDAMTYFSKMRFDTPDGISGPSQKRYVRYLTSVLYGGVLPRITPLKLRELTIVCMPQISQSTLFVKSGITPVISVFAVRRKSSKCVFTSLGTTFFESGNTVTFPMGCIVWGDVLVTIGHASMLGRLEPVCRFNLHTGFLTSKIVCMKKPDIDVAWRDKRFQDSFAIKLRFEDVDVSLIDPQASSDFILDENEHDRLLEKVLQAVVTYNPGVCWFGDNSADQIYAARLQGRAIHQTGWLTDHKHRKRWFSLTSRTLCIFTSPKESDPIRSIKLENVSFQKSSDYFQFSLIGKKYTLHLHADTPEDLRSWGGALEIAVTQAQQLHAAQTETDSDSESYSADVGRSTLSSSPPAQSTTLTIVNLDLSPPVMYASSPLPLGPPPTTLPPQPLSSSLPTLSHSISNTTPPDSTPSSSPVTTPSSSPTMLPSLSVTSPNPTRPSPLAISPVPYTPHSASANTSTTTPSNPHVIVWSAMSNNATGLTSSTNAIPSTPQQPTRHNTNTSAATVDWQSIDWTGSKARSQQQPQPQQHNAS
ncbi:phosphatidylinositol-3,4,5-trisphosphate 3-phosphatase [Pelomyxa schiedti]|nr:phosphatidylinositol-3,4,5-trisphosphate 3-phosphatase [Pelomyxa schiedti]